MLRVEWIGLGIGLLLSAWLMAPLWGQLTDSTFVHLQYARHLAEGRGPVLNAGEYVYGCTSPLWAALIADAIGLGFDALTSAWVLSIAASLATVPLFLQLMRRTVRHAPVRAFATIAWSANAWMIQWSTAGLETPLAVALMLAGFVAFSEGQSAGARPVRTGTLWALAALTRPQLVYLLVLWGVLLLVDANNRAGVRRLVFGALPPAIIYGTWLLFARVFFGTFWPRTLSLPPRPELSIGGNLWGQFEHVLRTETLYLGLLMAALVLVGRRWFVPRPTALDLLPVIWIVSLPFLYATRGIPPDPRYLLVILPVLAWTAWRAADVWWLGTDPESKPRRTQAAVVSLTLSALIVVQNVYVHRVVIVPQVTARTAAMRDGLVAWADWLGTHAPANAEVASTEVGALAFRARRRVLDLTGALSPQVESVTRHRPEAIVQLEFAPIARPEYLVHHAPRAFDLQRRSAFASALIPIGSGPAAVPVDSVITLYRIDWARYDEQRAAPEPQR
jgi:hypothetical protein